jgi:hypothetical protein
MPCNYCGADKKTVKGLCLPCYYRQKKNGTPEYVRKGKFTICTVDGCEGRAVSYGLCDKHRIRVKKHGNTETTLRPDDWGRRTSHPLYKLWHGMIRRCEDPKHKDYINYGSRGVSVCERWHDFWAFLDDMGPRPDASHSVDRIDNSGGYEPGNCRWASPQQQGRNRRTTVLNDDLAVEIRRRAAFGDKAGDISRALGIDRDIVRNVIIGHSWSD